jgi:hypothetical protein
VSLREVGKGRKGVGEQIPLNRQKRIWSRDSQMYSKEEKERQNKGMKRKKKKEKSGRHAIE